RVFGFILRSRKWASLHVDPLKPVKEDKYGFDRLKINAVHKSVIQGLVQTHYGGRSTDTQEEDGYGFDIVQAKGKGLIILLHGAPGVGKTSTAECVAALYAKTLFPITCDDLGMTPSEVEEHLDFNFQLAESWGYVLLLDDADVFLAERGHSDVKRNALVSVFLRALEYYRGIRFLTTNRVGTIDEAFKSRIHVRLLYGTLDWAQIQAIWESYIDKLISQGRVETNKTSIVAYAEELYNRQAANNAKNQWNGRQLRNAFQTAVAIAEY
ncbi:P-loop containing nucleoside triphosphate hydrolase protein, partial [Bimuria novae-zelandiae CBS 107.79]